MKKNDLDFSCLGDACETCLKEIRNKTIDEIKKIVSKWYDTSIKDKRIALMITNGGYIHKPTLLKKLEEMQEVGK